MAEYELLPTFGEHESKMFRPWKMSDLELRYNLNYKDKHVQDGMRYNLVYITLGSSVILIQRKQQHEIPRTLLYTIIVTPQRKGGNLHHME